MKNLIYIVSIDRTDSKVLNTEYAKYSIDSWEKYCTKYGIDLLVKTDGDTNFTYPIWNKELIYRYGKEYDKIGIVDSDTIVSPNAPNIFDLFDVDQFCGVNDLCDLNWLFDSIDKRQHLFPDINIDINQYINAGVLFFGNKYLSIFEELYWFYLENSMEIDSLKTGGKEQTLLNFIIQKNKVPVTLLNPEWNLLSIHKKNMFTYNWQLNIDQTPYFMKYAYIWHFTGFPIEDRVNVMKQVSEYINQ